MLRCSNRGAATAVNENVKIYLLMGRQEKLDILQPSLDFVGSGYEKLINKHIETMCSTYADLNVQNK